MARAVLPGVAHHLTQRGVTQQPVFFTDSDRRVYLKLVHTCAARCGVSLRGYCLMSNHVHWVVVPAEADSLTRVFGEAHSRYARYANAALNQKNHFWQNRFYSCSMDEAHLWAALRYVERNPVRAGLVDSAEEWPWSSAGAHAEAWPAPEWLSLDTWSARFTCDQWRLYLAADTLTEADRALRQNTYSGRPLGSAEFVAGGEAVLGRRLHAAKPGRPAKCEDLAFRAAAAQASLFDGL
jgi:putative transposase